MKISQFTNFGDKFKKSRTLIPVLILKNRSSNFLYRLSVNQKNMILHSAVAYAMTNMLLPLFKNKLS